MKRLLSLVTCALAIVACGSDTDSKVTISGPQSCTGTASQGAMALSCTPGTCEVALSR